VRHRLPNTRGWSARAVIGRSTRSVSMLLWFVKDQFSCVSEVLAGQGWATPVGKAGSY
jgi:hypothetical protein